MKTYRLFYGALLVFVLFSCEGNDLVLNKNKDQSFKGSFELLTSEIIPRTIEASGTSSLEIANGRFTSTTLVEGRGYGYSAGRLEITESKINFMDTVPKFWTGDILPPKYINGTYDYKFDGDKLEFGNKYESGEIEIYTLNLKK